MTYGVPPSLNNAQRKSGYDKSLRVRRMHAEVKRQLNAGEITLTDVLTLSGAQAMKVRDLLRALPGIGLKKANKALAEAGIPLKNTVKACGPKQLERLLQSKVLSH